MSWLPSRNGVQSARVSQLRPFPDAVTAHYTPSLARRLRSPNVQELTRVEQHPDSAVGPSPRSQSCPTPRRSALPTRRTPLAIRPAHPRGSGEFPPPRL